VLITYLAKLQQNKPALAKTGIKSRFSAKNSLIFITFVALIKNK